MSVKFQITLPETLFAELKQESLKIGVPVAELVRQTMADRLQKRNSVSGHDPFVSIDGLVDNNEQDLASRADEILYK